MSNETNMTPDTTGADERREKFEMKTESKPLWPEGPYEVGCRRPYIVACVRPEVKARNRHYVCRGEPTGGNGWPADGVAGLSDEQFEALAHLFSAAPELYAALVAARKYVQLGQESEFPGGPAEEILDQIDSALAKAKGGDGE